MSKEPSWEPKENPNEERSIRKQAILTSAVKNSLYFRFYNFQNYLIDAEIYFSNREARNWFYRNGYGIRYRDSDTFESIEFGLSVDYLHYRINPHLILKLKSQIFLGANNWKDYKTYEHDFYDAFIGDLTFSQSLLYNPLDKSSLILGIGLSEDFTYIYSKNFRIHAGILFHFGIKL